MNDWRNRAACLTEDPETFFPAVSGVALEAAAVPAKRVCAGCPVRMRCLAWALENREEHGIYGGYTPDERKSMRRSAQRRELARKQAAA